MIRRRIFSLAALLSLLLCVATVLLSVRSYTTFDDLDRIHTTRTPAQLTQHLIRLGSNNGRFLFTWRDIFWRATNPSFPYVISTWDKDNGVHFTHKKTFDFDRTFLKQPNDRSWESRFGGIRFNRLIHDATTPQQHQRPIRMGPPPDAYPGMTGVVVIVPHGYVAVIGGRPGAWLPEMDALSVARTGTLPIMRLQPHRQQQRHLPGMWLASPLVCGHSRTESRRKV